MNSHGGTQKLRGGAFSLQPSFPQPTREMSLLQLLTDNPNIYNALLHIEAHIAGTLTESVEVDLTAKEFNQLEQILSKDPLVAEYIDDTCQ